MSSRTTWRRCASTPVAPQNSFTLGGERRYGPPAPVRWAIYLAIAALALFTASHLFHAAWMRLTPAVPVEKLPLGFGFKSHGEALDRANRDIRDARARLALGPDEWIRWEGLAGALLSRAR